MNNSVWFNISWHRSRIMTCPNKKIFIVHTTRSPSLMLRRHLPTAHVRLLRTLAHVDSHTVVIHS